MHSISIPSIPRQHVYPSTYSPLKAKSAGTDVVETVQPQKGATGPFPLNVYAPCPRALSYRKPLYIHPFSDVSLLQRIREAVASGNPHLLSKTLKQFPTHRRRQLVNTSDLSGKALLFDVFTSKNISCTKLLLKAGANPFAKDSQSDNFAHLAIRKGLSIMLEVFLNSVTKEQSEKLVNEANQEGDTPLSVSCTYENTKCLEILLKFGANVIVFNKFTDTPYDITLLNQNEVMAQFLCKKEPRVKGVFLLCLLSHVFGVELSPVVYGKKIDLWGGYGIVMHRQILEDLKKADIQKRFFFFCGQHHYAELIYALKHSEITSSTKKKMVQKIREGELVIISTGWNEHVINLIFRDGYLVIGNRGEGCQVEGVTQTIFTQKINLSYVNEDLLNAIEEMQGRSFDQGAIFFYETLPSMLQAETDSFCLEMDSIAPKPSKAEVCAYAAAKTALRVAVFFFTNQPRLAKSASKAWAIHHREWVLEEFQNTPSPFNKEYCRNLIEVQSERLKIRKIAHLKKWAMDMQQARNTKETSDLLVELRKFHGGKMRRELEQCLIDVVQKGQSDPFSKKAAFLHPKFNSVQRGKAVREFIRRVSTR